MLVLTLLLLATGISGQYHPTQTWTDGFKADLHIPICSDLSGLRLHITFNQDVTALDQWTGQIEKVSNREYIISNAGMQLHSGEMLEFTIVGHGHGDVNPNIGIRIEGMTGCGGGSSTGTHTGTGTGGGHTSGTKDYADALHKSILFYDTQRSGKLPDNNPIPWRGDSFLNDCVVGGWFDAGDHVKFGLPFGATAHTLMWSLVKFKAGYQQAGQLDMMYDMIKWASDYILNAWNPHTQELVAQIGDGDADHAVWDRPENIHMDRPCIKVSPSHGTASDIAGDWAAAAAAGYLAFKDRDAGYAQRLLEAAKGLYKFGKDHQGVFSLGGPFYGSDSFDDEMCVGAMWLYRATRDATYLNEAKNWHHSGVPWSFNWGQQEVACQLFLYEDTHEGRYKAEVEAFLREWLPGGSLPYTPCGMAWRNEWGSNRYAGNTAYIALAAAEAGINPDTYRKWAVEQINFLLGDNNHDGGCFSYEIGYGNKFPRHPHHRAAANTGELLVGALVGGPDQSGNYVDDQNNWVTNEVAIDYNMGFHSALAAIVQLQHEGAMPTTNNKCPCNH